MNQNKDWNNRGGEPGAGNERDNCPVIVPLEKWVAEQLLLTEAFALTPVERAIRKGTRWVRGEPPPVQPKTEWKTIRGVTYRVTGTRPETGIIITAGPGEERLCEDVRWDPDTYYVPGSEEQCANALMMLLKTPASISLVRPGMDHNTWIEMKEDGGVTAAMAGTELVPKAWQAEPKVRALVKPWRHDELHAWLTKRAEDLLQLRMHPRAGIGARMWEVLVGRTFDGEERHGETRDYRRRAFHWRDGSNDAHKVQVETNDRIVHYHRGEPIGVLQTTAIERKGDEWYQDRTRLEGELNELVLKWDTDQDERG